MIPFVDLSRQHEAIADELNEAIQRVVRKSSFTLGEEVDAFEREFASFCGVEFAVGVGSGTDALHFALRACGVGPGDEVITAVNTFAATAEAIYMCGAKPVFVDIDDATYLIDTSKIERAITEKTRAIIPVHLYGQPVDMREILSIAERHGLKVIEDACQAHGAENGGIIAGASGDAGCFSFYPGKNLGAMGDGGIVVANNPQIAEKVRLLRNHGEASKYNHVEPGFCSRLHGLQAAILRIKLKYLPAWNAQRIKAAKQYTELLQDCPVITPVAQPEALHVYHLYVVRTRERNELISNLAGDGIATGVHYPTPLHLEPAFESVGYKLGDFPIAEAVASEILSLPIYPYLTATEIEVIVNALKKYTAVLV